MWILWPKISSFKAHMKNHIKVIHENQKPYECDTCGSCFTENSTLKSHNETVHLKKKKEYKCNHCIKIFSSQSGLNYHFGKLHLKSTGSKNKCNNCNKTFSHKGNLKKHISMFHGENATEHKCETCGKTFQQITYLHFINTFLTTMMKL